MYKKSKYQLNRKRFLKYFLNISFGLVLCTLPIISFHYLGQRYQSQKQYDKSIKVYQLLENFSTYYTEKKYESYYNNFILKYQKSLLTQENTYEILKETLIDPLRYNILKQERLKKQYPLFHLFSNINELYFYDLSIRKHSEIIKETRELLLDIKPMHSEYMKEIITLFEIGNYYSKATQLINKKNNYKEALKLSLKGFQIYNLKKNDNNTTNKFLYDVQYEIINKYNISYNSVKSREQEVYEQKMKKILLELVEDNKNIVKNHGNYFSLSDFVYINKKKEFIEIGENFKSKYSTYSLSNNIFNLDSQLKDIPKAVIDRYSHTIPTLYILYYFEKLKKCKKSYERIYESIDLGFCKTNKPIYQFGNELFSLLNIQRCYEYSNKYLKEDKLINAILFFKKGKSMYNEFINKNKPSKSFLVHYQHIVLIETLGRIAGQNYLLKKDDTKVQYYHKMILEEIEQASMNNKNFCKRYDENFSINYKMQKTSNK